ncbi:MAG: TIGR04283 family arsenosugar biosynthesis glycosyltransferase [Gemmatimonadota bacterium]
MPTVTVVVPALNEAGCVAAAIRSARDAGADEVIVSDGGSEDGTAAAARPLADAVVAAPRGRASQMNAGARASSGDVLLFLHADTRLPHGAIAAVRAAVARNGIDGGAFRVRLATSAAASRATKALLRLVGRMIDVRARVFRAYTGDQGIFVVRRVFEEMGGYPEIPLMEDVALSRMLRERGRTALLPVRIATSARRWESRGPARTILLMWGLRLAHRLGMSPGRCARLYGPGPATPRSEGAASGR